MLLISASCWPWCQSTSCDLPIGGVYSREVPTCAIRIGTSLAVPCVLRYARYGARCTMLLSTVSLAFCGLIRCLPLEGHAFMMMVQLSMWLGMTSRDTVLWLGQCLTVFVRYMLMLAPVCPARCFPLLNCRLANGMTAAWANIAGPLISDVWFPARERTLATATWLKNCSYRFIAVIASCPRGFMMQLHTCHGSCHGLCVRQLRRVSADRI